MQLSPTKTKESEVIQRNCSVFVKGDPLDHCMCSMSPENIFTEDASRDKDGYSVSLIEY
jgi:hypothetical protein